MLITAISAGAGTGACATASLSVSATVVSNHTCSFVNSTAAALPFGTLNPLAPANITRIAEVDIECKGNKNNPVIFSVTDNGGLHQDGSTRRMRNDDLTLSAPDAFIPYTMNITPASGSTEPKTVFTLTVEGTILGIDFQTAYQGSYRDWVTIVVEP